MKYTSSQKLDRITLARIFESARKAEVSSDVETLYSLFQNVWENIDEDPDFEEYEDLERAQLFRYYGFFLSHYGKTKNIPFFQERGKNLLTKAIDLFSFLHLSEKALDAEIVLGLCYFYEGAIEESEAVFEYISNLFDGNHLHPIYLRARLNSTMILQWKGEFQKALEIIEEIKVPMEFCQDAKLLIIYHTQAGLIYRGIYQYDSAIYHYNKCLKISQQENNWLVVGKIHNNQAFLYKNLKKFNLAHYHARQAMKISQKFKYVGWFPHFLDTKAIIYLEEKKFEAALKTINEAVSIFQKGDDYAGFADALWNKTKSLLYLNRKEEAIEIFTELCRIAQMRIGDYAVKRYSKLFAEIIYIKQNDSLEKEVKCFKESEIINALRRSNYNVNDAADLLGFSDSADFTKMLNEEFPSLYEEFGIEYLLKKLERKKIQKEKLSKKKAQNPKEINRIDLQDIKISFAEQNKSFLPSKIDTFYVSSEIMSVLFNIAEDVILATIPNNQPAVNKFVIAKRHDNDEYIFNQVSHDESLNIFYLLNDDEPFPMEELTVIGEAVSYCLFADVDNESLVFKPFPAVNSELKPLLAA